MIELNINENGSYSEFLKKKKILCYAIFLMVVYDYDLILLNNYQSLT